VAVEAWYVIWKAATEEFEEVMNLTTNVIQIGMFEVKVLSLYAVVEGLAGQPQTRHRCPREECGDRMDDIVWHLQ